MALLNCNPLLPRRSRLQWYRGRASILPMFRSLLLLTILTSVVAHVVEERRLIRSGVPRSRVRRQRSPTLVRDPLSVLSWRTIRGGGDSSSSRLEISKEWCTYIQNIDASNRTFYYQDAQDEIQGPFTRQELKNWRSQLPMDLPIMLQPEKIKAGSSVTLLAHLLEDEQLYNMWRMDVNDGSRDPENCGYCVSPTADEYQEEVILWLFHLSCLLFAAPSSHPDSLHKQGLRIIFSLESIAVARLPPTHLRSTRRLRRELPPRPGHMGDWEVS